MTDFGNAVRERPMTGRRASDHRRFGGMVNGISHAPNLPARGAEALPSALQALASLMDARSIDLLHRSGETGIVEHLVGSGGGDHEAGDLGLPDDDDITFIPVGQGAWAPLPGSGEATLFVKLIERRSGTMWAAIRFSDGEAAAPRLATRLSMYVTLLLIHATAITALEEARRQARAAMAALNHYDCGVFIVRFDHSMVFANIIGQAMLDNRMGLQLGRGKLRPLGYQDGIRFETALDCVIDASAKGASAARAGMALLLDVAEHDRPMLLNIVPVERGQTALHGEGAAAVVYATLAHWNGEGGLDTVCQIHGLSPVETQLVRHLVAGITIAEAATRMHVKVDTARAYLKQIFCKTGTNRQSSLVGLITRYQRGIHGDLPLPLRDAR